jgi:hypothetical protein
MEDLVPLTYVCFGMTTVGEGVTEVKNWCLIKFCEEGEESEPEKIFSN